MNLTLTPPPPSTRARQVAVATELLTAVPLLAPLPTPILRRMAALLHYHLLLPGDTVPLPTHPAALWLVLDGTLHLTRRGAASHPP